MLLEDQAECFEVWSQCRISTEDTNNTKVVLQADDSSLEVLFSDERRLASELRSLRAIGTRKIAGPSDVDLDDPFQPGSLSLLNRGDHP